MNPAWIHAVVLVCVFGAVVLAAESVIRWAASNRAEGQAIHWRLKRIGRDAGTNERVNLLRRTGASVPEGLPPIVDRFAHGIDRMLLQARLRIETPHVKRPPSEYVREHVWFTTQPIEEPDHPQHLA